MKQAPKLPPLMLLILLGLLMLVFMRLLPQLSFVHPLPPLLAFPVTLAGVGICLFGIIAFRRAQTTVDPLHPQQASRLVSGGVYRFTRNPMYLGFTLVLLGWALHAQHLLALALVPVFVLWIDRMQIPAEEEALAALFGDEYEAYRAAVRRWI